MMMTIDEQTTAGECGMDIDRLMRSRDETPNVVAMPHESTYVDVGLHPAPKAVREMAQNLIDDVHDHRHLRRMCVAILAEYKQAEPKPGKRTRCGSARKTGKVTAACGVTAQFVLTINWDMWQSLSSHRRLALLDHELSHCSTPTIGVVVPAEKVDEEIEKHRCPELGLDDPLVARGPWGDGDDQRVLLVLYDLSKYGRPVVRKHDVEEFAAVAGRWGPWTHDLAVMCDEMRRYEAGLFGG
jgi:hypothetical protein